MKTDLPELKRYFDWGGRRTPRRIDIDKETLYWNEWESDITHGLVVTADEWLAVRARHAASLLQNCVEINPKKCGGTPVLKGTRFSVARFLAELADGRSIHALASDFELDIATLEEFLRGLSICLDRPATR